MRRRVAVVGGGIAGLAAAVRVRDLVPGADIIVYEQSGVLGGKLRTGQLAGLTVERGAESFLVGAPDGAESAAVLLARRLGLGEALVHPAAVPAALAGEHGLESFPAGTLMGIPATGDEDRPGGPPLLGDGADVAVGELVRGRYSGDVVDGLVDPLLGGVYAGRADSLSLATTLPGLAAAAREEHTLAGAVRLALDRAAAVRVAGRPTFAAVDGGMQRLVGAAASACGARISLGLVVRELERTTHGWRLLLGPVPATQTDEVDAVILAVPAKAAARLLGDVDPLVANSVGALDYASVALAGFAFPAGTALPDLSGFLVPPRRGTLVKAATFFSRKWPHLPQVDAPVIVRASLGRAGEEQKLQHDDRTLTAIAHAELGELIGAALPEPVDSWVQRWGGGLPQYAPGHLDRVAAARKAVARAVDGIALAGAAYDGVGIPACVASGEHAAEDVCKSLED